MPAKIALTDLSVRAIKAPARGQLTVWDKFSPIGVRVSQGGSKTFILMVGSGQRRTIGRVGVLPLAKAREEAKRILAEKTLGIVKKKPSSVNFNDALTAFLDDHYRDKRPRVKSEAKRLLESHFLSSLKKKPLSEIDDTDIEKELRKLAHVPSEQLHAFRALRTMLRWCTRPPRRYLTHSPLEGYKAPSEDRKGTRILTDKELVAVWNAAEDQFGAMVRLLILWGARNGEVGRLRRSWIDGDILTIPGEFTKNKRDHSIVLLPMAKAILDEQPHLGDYFFTGRRGPESHFNDGSWGKLKKELDKKCGVARWQIRDLRRTFRSNMPKLGISRELSEILVNHVSGSRNALDEIYDRYDYLEEKKDALTKWQSRLSTLLQRS